MEARLFTPNRKQIPQPSVVSSPFSVRHLFSSEALLSGNNSSKHTATATATADGSVDTDKGILPEKKQQQRGSTYGYVDAADTSLKENEREAAPPPLTPHQTPLNVTTSGELSIRCSPIKNTNDRCDGGRRSAAHGIGTMGGQDTAQEGFEEHNSSKREVERGIGVWHQQEQDREGQDDSVYRPFLFQQQQQQLSPFFAAPSATRSTANAINTTGSRKRTSSQAAAQQTAGGRVKFGGTAQTSGGDTRDGRVLSPSAPVRGHSDDLVGARRKESPSSHLRSATRPSGVKASNAPGYPFSNQSQAPRHAHDTYNDDGKALRSKRRVGGVVEPNDKDANGLVRVVHDGTAAASVEVLEERLSFVVPRISFARSKGTGRKMKRRIDARGASSLTSERADTETKERGGSSSSDSSEDLEEMLALIRSRNVLSLLPATSSSSSLLGHREEDTSSSSTKASHRDRMRLFLCADLAPTTASAASRKSLMATPSALGVEALTTTRTPPASIFRRDDVEKGLVVDWAGFVSSTTKAGVGGERGEGQSSGYGDRDPPPSYLHYAEALGFVGADGRDTVDSRKGSLLISGSSERRALLIPADEVWIGGNVRAAKALQTDRSSFDTDGISGKGSDDGELALMPRAAFEGDSFASASSGIADEVLSVVAATAAVMPRSQLPPTNKEHKPIVVLSVGCDPLGSSSSHLLHPTEGLIATYINKVLGLLADQNLSHVYRVTVSAVGVTGSSKQGDKSNHGGGQSDDRSGLHFDVVGESMTRRKRAELGWSFLSPNDREDGTGDLIGNASQAKVSARLAVQSRMGAHTGRLGGRSSADAGSVGVTVSARSGGIGGVGVGWLGALASVSRRRSLSPESSSGVFASGQGGVARLSADQSRGVNKMGNSRPSVVVSSQRKVQKLMRYIHNRTLQSFKRKGNGKEDESDAANQQRSLHNTLVDAQMIPRPKPRRLKTSVGLVDNDLLTFSDRGGRIGEFGNEAIHVAAADRSPLFLSFVQEYDATMSAESSCFSSGLDEDEADEAKSGVNNNTAPIEGVKRTASLPAKGLRTSSLSTTPRRQPVGMPTRPSPSTPMRAHAAGSTPRGKGILGTAKDTAERNEKKAYRRQHLVVTVRVEPIVAADTVGSLQQPILNAMRPVVFVDVRGLNEAETVSVGKSAGEQGAGKNERNEESAGHRSFAHDAHTLLQAVASLASNGTIGPHRRMSTLVELLAPALESSSKVFMVASVLSRLPFEEKKSFLCAPTSSSSFSLSSPYREISAVISSVELLKKVATVRYGSHGPKRCLASHLSRLTREKDISPEGTKLERAMSVNPHSSKSTITSNAATLTRSPSATIVPTLVALVKTAQYYRAVAYEAANVRRAVTSALGPRLLGLEAQVQELTTDRSVLRVALEASRTETESLRCEVSKAHKTIKQQQKEIERLMRGGGLENKTNTNNTGYDHSTSSVNMYETSHVYDELLNMPSSSPLTAASASHYPLSGRADALVGGEGSSSNISALKAALALSQAQSAELADKLRVQDDNVARIREEEREAAHSEYEALVDELKTKLVAFESGREREGLHYVHGDAYMNGYGFRQEGNAGDWARQDGHDDHRDRLLADDLCRGVLSAVSSALFEQLIGALERCGIVSPHAAVRDSLKAKDFGGSIDCERLLPCTAGVVTVLQLVHQVAERERALARVANELAVMTAKARATLHEEESASALSITMTRAQGPQLNTSLRRHSTKDAPGGGQPTNRTPPPALSGHTSEMLLHALSLHTSDETRTILSEGEWRHVLRLLAVEVMRGYGDSAFASSLASCSGAMGIVGADSRCDEPAALRLARDYLKDTVATKAPLWLVALEASCDANTSDADTRAGEGQLRARNPDHRPFRGVPLHYATHGAQQRGERYANSLFELAVKGTPKAFSAFWSNTSNFSKMPFWFHRRRRPSRSQSDETLSYGHLRNSSLNFAYANSALSDTQRRSESGGGGILHVGSSAQAGWPPRDLYQGARGGGSRSSSGGMAARGRSRSLPTCAAYTGTSPSEIGRQGGTILTSRRPSGAEEVSYLNATVSPQRMSEENEEERQLPHMARDADLRAKMGSQPRQVSSLPDVSGQSSSMFIAPASGTPAPLRPSSSSAFVHHPSSSDFEQITDSYPIATSTCISGGGGAYEGSTAQIPQQGEGGGGSAHSTLDPNALSQLQQKEQRAHGRYFSSDSVDEEGVFALHRHRRPSFSRKNGSFADVGGGEGSGAEAAGDATGETTTFVDNKTFAAAPPGGYSYTGVYARRSSVVVTPTLAIEEHSRSHSLQPQDEIVVGSIDRGVEGSRAPAVTVSQPQQQATMRSLADFYLNAQHNSNQFSDLASPLASASNTSAAHPQQPQSSSSAAAAGIVAPSILLSTSERFSPLPFSAPSATYTSFLATDTAPSTAFTSPSHPRAQAMSMSNEATTGTAHTRSTTAVHVLGVSQSVGTPAVVVGSTFSGSGGSGSGNGGGRGGGALSSMMPPLAPLSPSAGPSPTSSSTPTSGVGGAASRATPPMVHTTTATAMSSAPPIPLTMPLSPPRAAVCSNNTDTYDGKREKRRKGNHDDDEASKKSYRGEGEKEKEEGEDSDETSESGASLAITRSTPSTSVAASSAAVSRAASRGLLVGEKEKRSKKEKKDKAEKKREKKEKKEKKLKKEQVREEGKANE